MSDPRPAPETEAALEAQAPAGASNAQTQLPPDPEAYDSPRASQARARGLAAPYIAGGRDPDIEQTRRDERRLRILLVAMIVAVVLAGFVLGVLQNLLGA